MISKGLNKGSETLEPRVYLLDKAYKQIQQEVKRHPHEETGGMLIGFATPDALIVTEATGPGPAAVHLPLSIRFDEKYCDRKARQLRRKSKSVRYLGDWHSHPFSKLKPSKVDKRSFALKASTHYQTPNPLMIIAGPAPLVSLRAYILANKIVGVQPTLIDRTMMRQLKTRVNTS